MKLTLGLLAVASYGATFALLNAGFPATPLYVSLIASAGAIALIIVEWARV